MCVLGVKLDIRHIYLPSILSTQSTHTNTTTHTGETEAAADAFHRVLAGNCQGPFGVWTERSPSEQGGIEGGMINFLPAAGGFLQSLLHGYAGLRLLETPSLAAGDGGEAGARLRLLPRCPPGVRSVRVRHVAFLGSHFALNYTAAAMTISFARSPPSGPHLVLVLPDAGGDDVKKDWGSARRVPLVPGSAVTVPVQEAFVVGILDREEVVDVTFGSGSPSSVGVVAATTAAGGRGKDCIHV